MSFGAHCFWSSCSPSFRSRSPGVTRVEGSARREGRQGKSGGGGIAMGILFTASFEGKTLCQRSAVLCSRA